MKCLFNPFLRRNQVQLDQKDNYSCLHGRLHYVWYRKEIIWDLGLSGSPGNKFVYIVYFYMSFFHFTQKFLLLLTMHAFF